MRRPDGTDPSKYDPGDYGRFSGSWWCRTPNGYTGNLIRHVITEHPDGTITVDPSILIRMPDRMGGLTEEELYHGFLRKGQWSPP